MSQADMLQLSMCWSEYPMCESCMAFAGFTDVHQCSVILLGTLNISLATIGSFDNGNSHKIAFWSLRLTSQPPRYWLNVARRMQALLMRIVALREVGRAVILLGDLNISLATIDSCDPGNAEDFNSRTDRRMLTTLLAHSGGPFLDTFRKFHPDR